MLLVELLVNGKEAIQFIEKGEGIYALPNSFKLKKGDNYQLSFKKTDGSSYKSSIEKLIEVPEILNVHDEFYEEGILRGEKYFPANFIYVDTKDPGEEKQLFMDMATLGKTRYLHHL